MRFSNILALLAFGPYAALVALAIGGAFVALFAAFAGFEQVKTIAGAVSGFCAMAFFVLLLSPLGEILALLPSAAARPAPPAAPLPLPSPPSVTPPTGRTLRKWMAIVAAVWTGLFLCLWLPVAAVYQHQVSRRPVAVAIVTDHRVHEAPDRRGRVTKTVHATLSFKRPDGAAFTDCRLENHRMGDAADPKAWATTRQLALHPLSCSEAVELPLQKDYKSHIIMFLVSLFALLFITGFIILTQRRVEQEHRAIAAARAGRPGI